MQLDIMDTFNGNFATKLPKVTVVVKSSNSSANNDREQKIKVAYGFQPIYIVSRLFGLMPYSIICKPNGEVKEARVKIFDLIWFIISICMCFAFALITFQNLKLPENKNESIILRIGDDLILIVGLLLGCVMIIIDMCNRFKLINILRQFEIFDKEVNRPISPFKISHAAANNEMYF